MRLLKYFWDYLVIALSVIGSIASIISICLQLSSDVSKTAIIVLGVLLLLSMCHDWYFSFKYRQLSGYNNIISELNTANSLIRNKKITNVQTATNILATYCESISSIFSTLKGHRIGVCTKLLVGDENDLEVITQARDAYSLSHNRKTGSADKTKHKLESNSDFSFIYNKFDSDVEDSTFFHSSNLVQENDYRNSRLNDWHIKNIPFVPKSFSRKWNWPLPYKSTIVVPIFPLDSDSQSKDDLRGFLCVDSEKTRTFEIPIDKEILRGFAAEICPVIDRLHVITNNTKK